MSKDKQVIVDVLNAVLKNNDIAVYYKTTDTPFKTVSDVYIDDEGDIVLTDFMGKDEYEHSKIIR